MKRVEYFAFAVNEYSYKHIGFKRHYKRKHAEKSSYRPYRGTAQSDYSATIITGREAFEQWAKECGYEIDWKNKILTYQE